MSKRPKTKQQLWAAAAMHYIRHNPSADADHALLYADRVCDGAAARGDASVDHLCSLLEAEALKDWASSK